MNRRHLKNTPAARQFKINNLQHNRQYLRQINKSHNHNKKRHLHHVSRSRHKTAQRKRPGITHKHTGRMNIKQQKPKKRSRHRTGNRLDTASHTDRCHTEKSCHKYGDRTGQAIQAVRKISSVAGSDHNKKKNGNIHPAKIQILVINKRHLHGQRNIRIPCQIENKNTRYHDLQQKFLPCLKPHGALPYNLNIVIQKTNQPKSQHKEQNRNNPRTILHKENGSDYYTHQNENTSHGRCPVLL